MIFFSGVVWLTRDLPLSCNTLYLLSPRLCVFKVQRRDLCVYRDDSCEPNKQLNVCTDSKTESEVVHVKLV